jgi:transcription elongation GreA/GreB family factor
MPWFMLTMNAAIDAIIAHLHEELTTASAASEQAHASATHSENVADNKYDTLAVEAAYLAHGQSVRITQLQQSIASYRQLMSVRRPDTASIHVGHTVTILDANDKLQRLFIGPSAGGIRLFIDALEILTITPQTPMGKALMGKAVDDEITVAIGANSKYFVVTGIC